MVCQALVETGAHQGKAGFLASKNSAFRCVPRFWFEVFIDAYFVAGAGPRNMDYPPTRWP